MEKDLSGKIIQFSQMKTKQLLRVESCFVLILNVISNLFK
ncbi:hypothetical protein RC62_2122 [Flavobacterium aquidurense]|uniref:Uncharacterized protein n=1 Tax=Flavobacterium aquidurense TaxID=362413 RepID=A0A0Q0WSI6_9FLAO|nr:hypothetical protein RC62_2122 [Flavobacterium aquidurense]